MTGVPVLVACWLSSRLTGRLVPLTWPMTCDDAPDLHKRPFDSGDSRNTDGQRHAVVVTAKGQPGQLIGDLCGDVPIPESLRMPGDVVVVPALPQAM